MTFFGISQNSTLVFLVIFATIAMTAMSTNYWSPVNAEILETEMSEDGTYIILESSLDKQISEFTISSWVTPDFSEGSSELTIVSRANAYGLGIDQGDKEGPKLVFTIFDGMKWHVVESNVKVEEVLTHVAATFGDSTIDIYLNGNNVGTLSDIEKLTLNDKGILRQVSLESISSGSDDIAGAYVTERRGEENVSREFGGIIHVIELLDKKYDEQEIKDLFNASFEMQNFSEAEEIAPDVESETEPEIQEFNEGTVLVSSGTESNTSLILSSQTTSNNDNSDGNSILDGILANLQRIAEKFSAYAGFN